MTVKRKLLSLVFALATPVSIFCQGQAYSQWVDLDIDNTPRSGGTSLDQIEKIQQTGPARQRAVNLARSYAVELNGGLANYRPNSCMFSSSATGCLIDVSERGFLFRFTGGSPGWQQLDLPPSRETEILVSPDGRSVSQLIYNGSPR